MLKKIDGLDAKRYHAIRSLAMLHAHDQKEFDKVMALLPDGDSATSTIQFDVDCDAIIEAFEKRRLIVLLENEMAH